MTLPEDTIANRILADLLLEYENGNPEPLAAMVASGAPEVYQNERCRMAIADALIKTGKKGKSGSSNRTLERNLRVVVLLHVSIGFGLKVREAITVGSIAFNLSDETIQGIWSDSQGRGKTKDRHLWLIAREAGLHITRPSCPGAPTAELIRVSTETAETILRNQDNLLSLRMAAASGLIKH